ncbi:MAG: hypothetical protein R3F53_20350 [Gammaproteobacteria bacterium]
MKHTIVVSFLKHYQLLMTPITVCSYRIIVGALLMLLAILRASALPIDKDNSLLIAQALVSAEHDQDAAYKHYEDIRKSLDVAILIGEGGFVSAGGTTPQSFQPRAGQGNALVSITQSQAQPSATGLLNISYNGLVPATGTIAGFIVTADAPTASQFVITAETLGLPDPEIELFEITQNGSIERATNDNCTQDLSALVGRDFRNGVNACLNETLPPGLYFVSVTDVGGASGKALISITQPSGSVPALLNLSYNGLVEVAGIRLGFIVGSTQTFALTAETLGLPDPAMTLYQITPEGNQIVASNDNCEQDLTAHVGRDFRNGEDACLLLTLELGLYFVEVVGKEISSTNCVDIAGAWDGAETVTITCTVDGDTDTDTQSSTGIIAIEQNECRISYKAPGLGTTRSGTVDGNRVSVSGPFAVALNPSVTFSRNEATAEGTVDGDQMILNGSGVVSGTDSGVSFSCRGNSRGTFTRLNSTGGTCEDVAGTYRGTYTSNYCDGERYSGTFSAIVNPQNCAIEFTTSDGNLGSGVVKESTFQISTNDLECGAVTGSGSISGNSISGSYRFSLGGSGSFSGSKQ